MAQGDLVIFEENAKQLTDANIDLAGGTWKFGIVDNTITPTAADATPTWTDYSANDVSAGGGYVAGGITLTSIENNEVGGIATFKADSFTLAKNASGFTNGYWGIVYESVSGLALGFVDLGGPISEVANTLNFLFNSVAVGSPGSIMTTTVSNP